MVGEWREATVGEFTPFDYGKGLPEHRRNLSGEVPVFGSNGVVGFHDKALTCSQTVIIGRKGTVGAVHYSPKPCWPIDTTFYVIDPDPDVLRFKYYLLKSLGLEHMNADSAVPGLNRDAAHARKILVPHLPEQRTIAHILGTLDDKIELNRKQNETLEAMARALFKAWFVDFEPVRAKMEGRWQRGQSLPGLPAHLYDLFPDRLVESELGEIPEGWEMRSLDSIANYLNGLALQKFPPESDDEFLPVIKIAQLRAGNTDGADRASARIKPEYVVVDGDVLFSWSGSLEVVIWCGGRGALNQHLFKITSNEVPKWFYYYATLHHLLAFRAIAAGKATTMGHIQRKHLTDARIAVAPLSDMKNFDAFISPLFDQMVNIAQQSRTLAQLRDTLLSKLISGELRVKHAERIVESAV
ncbi:restriction endonuclease subunit S [uncultured Tepidimonas sp.]|uniref:restriction endonuclease subunit S n=1 Tax=uncultured Tepidimonas sp. TaxID=453579 RepID=UPI002616BE4F|nr:restriction endonuclease subunit S [uncultured Tepidimonas sp.]